MVEELCTRPASTWILLTSESWEGARVQVRIAMPGSTWRRMLSDVSDRRVGGQWSRLGVRGWRHVLRTEYCRGQVPGPCTKLFTTWPDL